MDICLLSINEAARLENYGVWPNCKKSHHHLKKRQAEVLIAADTHRFVGGVDTQVGFVSAIVECDNSRVWRNRPSGGPLGTVVKQYIRL